MFDGDIGAVGLLAILVIAVIVFGPKTFSGGPTGRNGRKGGRPQHPLPVTGAVEKTPQKDQTESLR